MQLAVTLEMHFKQTPDGKLWTPTMFPYIFWKRYLQVFESVKIIARTELVDELNPEWKRVDGEGVSYVALPYYHGPVQYLRQRSSLQAILKQAICADDALLLRVPSIIATDCLTIFPHHPYGLEVVGDPYDVFAPNSVRHPLRNYFCWHSVRHLKRQCKNALAVSYVTREALQSRYPASQKAHHTFFSDVELFDDAFTSQPRTYSTTPSPLRLCMVGTLEQLYKAPDILLHALHHLKTSHNLDVQLTLVGDGKYRPELETLSQQLDLMDNVRFTGMLSGGEAVRRQLDQSDLFVLPSRQEGLPRAMIEAMARGLPCIGSTVGGIPELIPLEDCVPPGDIRALANKIYEISTSADRLNTMAERNWDTAHQYRNDILNRKRIEFYTYLRNTTDEYLRKQVTK